MREAPTRSVLKTISWRIIATLTTTGLVYLLTDKLALALEVGLLEMALKLLFYYLHERAWGRIWWGRMRHPLEQLPVKQDLAPDDIEIIHRRLEEMGYV